MADTKISLLTECTDPQTTDILPIVDDPAGTPITKKVTVANLVALAGGTSGVVKLFTTAMTQADFATMVADMTIDVIEMQGGTYQDWHMCVLDVDRTSRPLLVRPAPGATVIWDGTTDASTDGVFYFGTSTTKAAYITFDIAGTSGSFIFQNYTLGETGLINVTYTDHLTFNGFTVRSCNDSVDSGWTRWAIYTHLNGSYQSNYLTANDWDCDSTGGDGFVNHLQLYSVVHGTFKRWRVKGGRFACHLGSGNSSCLVEGWIMTTVITPFDNENSSYVVIRDCFSTPDCGSAILGTNTTDGGGNNWGGVLPIAGGTISGDITFGENTAAVLDPAGSADEKWTGVTIAGTAGATLASGDLCYLNSSWQWALANASTVAASGSVCLGICLTAATSGNATKMLLYGTIRSSAFPASITGGAQLYVSGTAGDMTTTQPSTTNYVIRVIGWAITTEPNTIYFNPSPDFITHT